MKSPEIGTFNSSPELEPRIITDKAEELFEAIKTATTVEDSNLDIVETSNLYGAARTQIEKLEMEDA